MSSGKKLFISDNLRISSDSSEVAARRESWKNIRKMFETEVKTTKAQSNKTSGNKKSMDKKDEL